MARQRPPHRLLEPLSWNLPVRAFAINKHGDNAYALEGDLTFATVPEALKATARLFRPGAALRFDLVGIERVDSAGVALLIEWLRRAEQSGCALRLVRVPDRLRAMARVSGVEELLPMAVEPTS